MMEDTLASMDGLTWVLQQGTAAVPDSVQKIQKGKAAHQMALNMRLRLAQ